MRSRQDGEISNTLNLVWPDPVLRMGPAVAGVPAPLRPERQLMVPHADYPSSGEDRAPPPSSLGLPSKVRPRGAQLRPATSWMSRDAEAAPRPEPSQPSSSVSRGIVAARIGDFHGGMAVSLVPRRDVDAREDPASLRAQGLQEQVSKP